MYVFCPAAGSVELPDEDPFSQFAGAVDPALALEAWLFAVEKAFLSEPTAQEADELFATAQHWGVLWRAKLSKLKEELFSAYVYGELEDAEILRSRYKRGLLESTRLADLSFFYMRKAFQGS